MKKLFTVLVLICSFFTVTSTVFLQNYNDNIENIRFENLFPGSNSGAGNIILTYETIDGKIKEISFAASRNTKLEDIDGDSIREIIVPRSIGYPILKLPRVMYPTWVDIYRFNVEQEDLILVSRDFPQYYKNCYIPMIQNELKTYINFTSDAIKARKIILVMAQGIVDGEYIPTEYGKNNVNERFHFLFYNQTDY